MTGIVEICSLLDATLDGMTDVAEVRLLLKIVTFTVLVGIRDGVMIEGLAIVATLVDIFNGIDVSLMLDAVLVELSESKEINVLFEAILVNVIDGVNICPLLDVALACIADV